MSRDLYDNLQGTMRVNAQGKITLTTNRPAENNKCDKCANKNHEIDNLRRLLANVSERIGKLKS